MLKENISDIDRISIDLTELKPIADLKYVYEYYKNCFARYFDEQGNPKKHFFNYISCPICGCSDAEFRVKIDNFVYIQCNECFAVYNSPCLKEEVLEKMYKSGEYSTYFSKLVISSQGLRKNLIDVRKCRQINSLVEHREKILDVGCGSGSFLKVCKENGWDVYGMDPSEAAVKFAKEKYGLNIIQKGFEIFSTDIIFDCITFWGLEHLARPMDGVAKAYSMLAPDGLIVFESPSADCFLMKYLCKNNFNPYRYIESARHVLFFSKRSIDFICEKYSLVLDYLETSGLDIQTILLKNFDIETMSKLMKMQQIIDECMLGDHYRVFLRKLS